MQGHRATDEPRIATLGHDRDSCVIACAQDGGNLLDVLRPDDRRSRTAEASRPIDDMARDLGMPVHELGATLMALEMIRAVRRLPGNQYERR